MTVSRWWLVLPLMTALPVLAQTATLLRDSELKSEPFSNASRVTAMKAKQTIEVGERRGGWYQAKTSTGQTGWVRLTAVLLGSGQAKGDSGLASTAQFLQSGRSGSSGVTAATGIRGLDSADVVNAKPDPEAVAKLDGLQVGSDETRRFAAEANLSSQKIGYQPAAGK
ncbi:MAG TPA: SH3 domain-containing protein [Gammaproteobacteria bacterium]